MARPKSSEELPRRRRPPATTAKDREQELINLAVDLAEKQIRQGTVSAQVLTHYLKLATEKEKLEQSELRKKNDLLDARVKSLESIARSEELFDQAIKAMRLYSGQEADDDEY